MRLPVARSSVLLSLCLSNLLAPQVLAQDPAADARPAPAADTSVEPSVAASTPAVAEPDTAAIEGDNTRVQSEVPSDLATAQWGALSDDLTLDSEDPSVAASGADTTAAQDAGFENMVTISARVMAGFAVRNRRPVTDAGLEDETKYGFRLQQARVRVEVQPNKRLQVVLSADFSDALDPTDFSPPPYLRNAYLDFEIEKRWLEVRAGRFKRPYSRIELRSAGDLPMRGRGLANDLIVEDGGWGDRAVGVMLSGRVEAARVRWWLSAQNPAWAVANEPQGVDLLARVTWDVNDALELGVAGGRKWIDRTVGATQTGMAFDLDARLRVAGFELLTEMLLAQQARIGGHPLSMGLVGVATYQFPISKNVRLQPMLFGEWTDADIEFSGNDAVRTLLGLNVLWKKSFRIMPQFEIVRPIGTANPLTPWKSERLQITLAGEM